MKQAFLKKAIVAICLSVIQGKLYNGMNTELFG